jgi:SAM-dependent methyltransferase
MKNENNLLDRLTPEIRLGYCYDKFIETEKVLVREKICKVVSQGKVLNVGCGPHGTERRLFPAEAYDIYGVDIDGDSLQVLSSRNLYRGLVNASIASLPIAAARFDIVYLRLVLHHLVYPQYLLEKGITECFRVLKPGGVLALVEPNSWHPLGALLNLAHRIGLDAQIHGHDDDVALSPLRLRKELAANHGANISVNVVSYSWRRLPIPVQSVLNGTQQMLGTLNDKLPYFGHTLMMTAIKEH